MENTLQQRGPIRTQRYDINIHSFTQKYVSVTKICAYYKSGPVLDVEI